MKKLNRLLNHSETEKPGLIKDTVEDILRFDPVYLGNTAAPSNAIRRWEYGWGIGNLLGMLEGRDLTKVRWLDIGSCDSILPLYLASLGIQVSISEFPEYRDHYLNNSFGLEVDFIPIENTDRSLGVPKALEYSIKTNKSFDVITCISTLEHLPPGEERYLLAEIAKLLKPGGLVYLTTDVNTEANYDPNLRIGKQSLLWHIYDKKMLKSEILDPSEQHGLKLIGDLDYQTGKPEYELDHPIAKDICNVIALFMRKEC